MSPTFNLANQIKHSNAYSNADYYYGVWSSLSEAKVRVPYATRKKGRTVGVLNNQGSIDEYWWKNGVDDDDLILKQGVIPNKPKRVNITDPLIALQGLVIEKFCTAATNILSPSVTFEPGDIPYFSAVYNEEFVIWTLNNIEVNRSFGEGEENIDTDETQIVSRRPLNIGAINETEPEYIDIIATVTSSDNVWEQVNLDDYNVRPLSQGFTIFKANVDGEIKNWLYKGQSGSVGLNGYNTIEQDFQLLNPSESGQIENHSELNLDDGTNPHGTTAQDLGLGVVATTNNYNDLDNLPDLTVDTDFSDTSTNPLENREISKLRHFTTALTSNLDVSQVKTYNNQHIITSGNFAIDIDESLTDMFNLLLSVEPTKHITINPSGTATVNKTFLQEGVYLLTRKKGTDEYFVETLRQAFLNKELAASTIKINSKFGVHYFLNVTSGDPLSFSTININELTVGAYVIVRNQTSGEPTINNTADSKPVEKIGYSDFVLDELSGKVIDIIIEIKPFAVEVSYRFVKD